MAATDPLGLAGAFADALSRLEPEAVRGGEARQALRALAVRLWQACAAGDVCIPVTPAESRGLADGPALTRHPRVAIAPIVLEAGHAYLGRHWLAESGLAQAILGRDQPAPVAAPEQIDAVLSAVFGAVDESDAQWLAARTALQRRLCVVTGGPGTGKTTTLARLLVAHARLRPGARVAFAAPTGKAAARLAQSLAQAIAGIDAARDLSERIPRDGFTVHRLLSGGRGVPVPAALDLLIVDEASMLDLELAHRLLQALGPQTRLVMAGDRDQLASVQAGAVFAELCEAPLRGRVRLTRNYRQREAPAIADLAGAVRDGEAAAIERVLAGSDLCQPPDPRALAEDAWRAHEPAIALALRSEPADDAHALAVLQAYERRRVLCARRPGPLGADVVNRAIASRLAPHHPAWYPGRLVMISRNDAHRRLFNGDVGVCLARQGDGAGLAVAFADGGSVRWVEPSRMPPCEDAWAITVHKSQGSEFDEVVLVLAGGGHALDTRELAYTGITRARRRLVLRGHPQDLLLAASRPLARQGRLAIRLAGGSEA